MINGLEPNSAAWFAVKDWAEKRKSVAQIDINSKGVPERDADYARGRLSLADDLLDDIKPPKAPDYTERPKDKSGY